MITPDVEPYPSHDDGVPGLVEFWATLTLLVLNGVLIAAFGLVYNPMYWNGVAVPLGALFTLLVLPWLVLQAGDLDTRPAVAGAPLIAWVVTVGVLVLIAPGGDVLLPSGDWRSWLLIVAGLGGGLVAVRTVVGAIV